MIAGTYLDAKIFGDEVEIRERKGLRTRFHLKDVLVPAYSFLVGELH